MRKRLREVESVNDVHRCLIDKDVVVVQRIKAMPAIDVIPRSIDVGFLRDPYHYEWEVIYEGRPSPGQSEETVKFTLLRPGDTVVVRDSYGRSRLITNNGGVAEEQPNRSQFFRKFFGAGKIKKIPHHAT